MEPSEYERLARIEDDHWWFRILRARLDASLAALGAEFSDRILDLGCGTGGLLRHLAARHPRVQGLDFSEHAAAYWARRGTRGVRGDANRLPFRSGSFAGVVSIDLLSEAPVREADLLAEARRVLCPGGWLLLTSPAHRFLYSAHDRAVHSARRYEREEIRRLLFDAGFRIERLTHMFPTFLPAVAVVRLSRRNEDAAAGSDLFSLPRPLNALLTGIGFLENAIGTRIDYPVGSTILAAARRS